MNVFSLSALPFACVPLLVLPFACATLCLTPAHRSKHLWCSALRGSDCALLRDFARASCRSGRVRRYLWSTGTRQITGHFWWRHGTHRCPNWQARARGIVHWDRRQAAARRARDCRWRARRRASGGAWRASEGRRRMSEGTWRVSEGRRRTSEGCQRTRECGRRMSECGRRASGGRRRTRERRRR